MIEFENVSFSYTGQEHGGLHDINLKISDGECVLFCGRSGCGKTTITRLVNGLIPQFYQLLGVRYAEDIDYEKHIIYVNFEMIMRMGQELKTQNFEEPKSATQHLIF